MAYASVTMHLLMLPSCAGNPAPVQKTERPGAFERILPWRFNLATDDMMNQSFLCDTGASTTLFPTGPPQLPLDSDLCGPGGQLIPCWGEQEQTLQLCGIFYIWILC